MNFVSAFFFTLIMFGMFAFIWIALDQAHTDFKTFADSNIDDADTTNTVSLLNIMWLYIPGGVLFSFAVWAINRSRGERDLGL